MGNSIQWSKNRLCVPTRSYEYRCYKRKTNPIRISLHVRLLRRKTKFNVKLIEPPCTERYARWCERSGILFKIPSYSIEKEFCDVWSLRGQDALGNPCAAHGVRTCSPKAFCPLGDVAIHPNPLHLCDIFAKNIVIAYKIG